jgi:hypothetical protein
MRRIKTTIVQIELKLITYTYSALVVSYKSTVAIKNVALHLRRHERFRNVLI